MRLAVIVCVILIIFVGFQFYDVIQDEIQEAKMSPLNEVDMNNIPQLAVDDLLSKVSYSYRKTFYENPSSDIIKAASSLPLNGQYATIVYYEDEFLVHEEFKVTDYSEIDLETIKGSCIFIVNINSSLKTNLKENDYTVYDLGNQFKLFYITPEQTGEYYFMTDDLTIKYELRQK
ncbi:MAG: hypothetical protein JXR88_10410 [Clostridia bacterium]|nr:hypothetical protein [Clostridia bacterium]